MSIQSLYLEDKYIENNPTLHEEDSIWKVCKILPLIDKLFKEGYINKNEISILDVGGGAGIILKEVTEYIVINYNVKVNKICLDLSPSMLTIQEQNNPNAEILNENICNSTLKTGSIDITLMIDVLEHIPDWEEALEELRRISDFVIFKLPLERNLLNVTLNYVKNGEIYEKGVESMGHINWFDMNTFAQGIKLHFGHILSLYYTNVFQYNQKFNFEKYSKFTKVMCLGGRMVFFLSPSLCSRLFSDFVMLLAKSSKV